MDKRTPQLPDIHGSASVETAARLMLFWDTDRVEVFDESGRSKGIVTERDMTRSVATGGRPSELRIDELLGAAELRGLDCKSAPGQIPLLRDPVAQDIMSSPAVACSEDAPLDEVADLLGDREISGLPVVDLEDRVVGVISEHDLARALGAPLIRLAIGDPLRTGPFLRQPHLAKHARDIMSTPPTVGHLDTPMWELADTMVRERINRVPIVHRERLVGIVTRGDILAAVAGTSRKSTDMTAPPAVVGRRARLQTRDFHHTSAAAPRE